MKRLVVIVLVLAAGPAAAHEVVTRVANGRGFAVRAEYSDGEPLANAAAQVFSPKDPGTPHLDGRTDRNGWIAFVPDAPGAWRVRISEPDGHGLDTVVDVPATSAPAAAAGGSAPSTLGFALRPIFGLVALAAIFGALFAFGRRRAKPR